MRARLDEFEGVDVVVVTFARHQALAGYRRRFAEPLTVVSDEDRRWYRAFGFGRGSITRVWGWRSASAYLRLMARGKRPGKIVTRADTLQLGGNVVIDKHGQVAWVYPGEGPDDRPSVDELLAAVRALV